MNNLQYDSNVYKIYVIHNRITKENSMFIHNIEELAKRHFIKSVNMGNMEKPEEFEMWEIGEWNKWDLSGKFYEKKLILIGFFEQLPDSQVKKVISSFVEEIMGQKIEQILKIAEMKSKKVGEIK